MLVGHMPSDQNRFGGGERTKPTIVRGFACPMIFGVQLMLLEVPFFLEICGALLTCAYVCPVAPECRLRSFMGRGILHVDMVRCRGGGGAARTEDTTQTGTHTRYFTRLISKSVRHQQHTLNACIFPFFLCSRKTYTMNT